MAEIYTGPDQLRLYRTGADAAGAAVLVADLSLGAFRSGTREVALAHSMVDAVAGLRLDYVSGTNGTGNAGLWALGADSVAWRAPGGVLGAAVTIANGETKVLVDGGDANKFVVVTRTSATDLSGAATVALSRYFGGAVGFDDADGEAGATSYRCLALYNGGAAAVENVTVSVLAGSDGLTVGVETPRRDMVQDFTGIGDAQAPGGVSFGASAEIDEIGAGEWAAVWLRRVVAAETTATPERVQGVSWAWGAYENAVAGAYRVFDVRLRGYRVYVGQDAEPDFTAAPDAESATLPVDTSALDGGHVYHIATRYRNAYGLESQNTETEEYRILVDGTLDYDPPSAPFEVSIAAAAGAAVRVRAFYDSDADGDDAADTWLVYLNAEGEPDPEVDVPIEVALSGVGGIASLDYTSSAFADNAEVHVLVRTRRTETEADVDSENVDTYSTTTDLDGPTIERRACQWEASGDVVETVVWEQDGDNYIDQVPGALRFYLGGELVAALGASGILHLHGGLKTAAWSGATQAEHVAWGAGNESVVFGVGADPIFTAMELYPSGDLHVYSVMTAGAWPLSDVAVDADNLIEWHDGAGLDFSRNGETISARLAAVEYNGAVNGQLQIRGVRTNAF